MQHLPLGRLTLPGWARATSARGGQWRAKCADHLAWADKHWQLWDGRADSAWAQATIPFEDPNEMASSRLYIAHAVAAKYAEAYTQIFGPLPPLTAAGRFPAEGGPGSAAWHTMAEADRTSVSRLLANIGKAIAAYIASLRPEPCALDRYADGDVDALSEEEKDGLQAFFAAGCAQCHHGPRLTDDSFHNLRFPTGRLDRSADLGRNAGLEILAQSEFRRSGSFSDDPSLQPMAAHGDPRLTGAFKTPGLRGAAFTLPLGHGGSFGGLTSTLDALREGLPPNSPYATGEADFALINFDRKLTPSLVTFLNGLRLDLPAEVAARAQALQP